MFALAIKSVMNVISKRKKNNFPISMSSYFLTWQDLAWKTWLLHRGEVGSQSPSCVTIPLLWFRGYEAWVMCVNLMTQNVWSMSHPLIHNICVFYTFVLLCDRTNKVVLSSWEQVGFVKPFLGVLCFERDALSGTCNKVDDQSASRNIDLVQWEQETLSAYWYFQIIPRDKFLICLPTGLHCVKEGFMG